MYFTKTHHYGNTVENKKTSETTLHWR